VYRNALEREQSRSFIRGLPTPFLGPQLDVQSAAVDEAVAEFERRFEPLLDQELWKMAQLEPATWHALAMEMSIIETSEIFASVGACDTASPLQQPTHPPRGRSPQPSMAPETERAGPD
jgi:hypothetical protein